MDDIDNDGRVEILAVGVNNSCDHRAILVILDPARISGSAPICGDSTSAFVPQSYVLFPNPEIFQAIGVSSQSPRGLSLNRRNGIPEINIGTRVNVPGTGLVSVCTYHLDYDLNVIDIVMSGRILGIH